jgi:erythrocyte band 7 integral membrane protein
LPKARGPGVFFVLPYVDAYEIIDMRTQTFNVPPQEVRNLQRFLILLSPYKILTKDSVTIHVTAIMYYKVDNATCAVSNVDDYGGSAQLLAATTLRNCLGTRNLGDILSEKESIALEMKVRMPYVL